MTHLEPGITKGQIIRTVFLTVLTLLALISCFLTVMLRLAEPNPETAENGLENAFGTFFMVVFEAFSAAATAVSGGIGILLGTAGWRMKAPKARILNRVLLCLDAGAIITSVCFVFLFR